MADELTVTTIAQLPTVSLDKVKDAMKIPVSNGVNKAEAVTFGVMTDKVIEKIRETDYEIIKLKLTSSVEGVSTAGLVVNVYINQAEQPVQYTADASGKVTFSIATDNVYKIVYPDVEGCVTPRYVQHTAAIMERSIEAEYVSPSSTNEKVVIHTIKYVKSVGSAYAGAEVKVRINGEDTTYTTDSNGKVQIEIPVGTTYAVMVNNVEGYYILGSKSQTYTATISQRQIYFNYHDMTVGAFIVDNLGISYTYDEWVASGKSAEDAVMFKCATAELMSNHTEVYFLIDDIANGRYTTTYTWCSQSVTFTSIPSNGNSSSAEFYYDGLGATQAIVNEGVQRGLTTTAASTCYQKTYNLNNATMQGFLYGIGQERAIYANRIPFEALLSLVRPNATKTFANYFSTKKWTSAQSGGAAYYVTESVSTNISKGSGYGVLVSYALPL